ncbi:MAG: hypothetical protein A2161_10910 [Candidatus Schekmanbacteria bacterium RBG_13_48_7]|uniref:HDOD domain-containing protein n=1 Tax=Candidatus Schekmanbacteria bacterium RBG_13_48_7 TaxID=1817878 RepID=A0A1F7RQN3_9BACT|nr:MAG: hypothetical protein A2161_10910 [Candidatus Schekmanbacteria bacterium RBG_13_48_7]
MISNLTKWVSKTMSKKKDLRDIVLSVQDLPTLPIVVSRAMSIIANGSSSSRELAELISHDQTLTSRMLRIVNSALYGFPRKISTVNDAIVILGFRSVRAIAMAASVIKLFPQNGNSRFNHKRFWFHSTGVGICSQLLSKELGIGDDAEIFTAGILHDIGKLIIDQFSHEEFQGIIHLMELEKINFLDSEKKFIRTSHAELGGMLCEAWSLPKNLVQSISSHHIPEKISDKGTAIAYLANYICNVKNLTCFENGMKLDYDSAIVNKLGIDENVIDNIFDKFDDSIYRRALEFVEII